METHVDIQWVSASLFFVGPTAFIVVPAMVAKAMGEKYIGKTVLWVLMYILATGPLLLWLVFHVILGYEGWESDSGRYPFEKPEWWSSYFATGVHLLACCGVFRRYYVAIKAAKMEQIE